MSNARVKVSIDHMREDIAKYLEVEATEKAPMIAAAVKEAVDAFDFDAAVSRVCEQELDKFVRDAAGVYFRTLLKSTEAHAVVLDTLRHQLEGTP